MSKINEQQKKVLDIVITSVQILAVVLSVVLSIIIIANPNIKNAEINEGSTKLLPVLTDSMKGDGKDNFSKGDLIIAKALPEDLQSLEVGQIVTFLGQVNAQDALITHRIIAYAFDNLADDDPIITIGVPAGTAIAIHDGGSNIAQYYFVIDSNLFKNADGSYKTSATGKSYKEHFFGYCTHGDYPVIEKDENYWYNMADSFEIVTFENLRAVYKSHIGGVGKVIEWLQEPTHFLLVIVLPLLALFIYNLIMFIKMIMEAKVAAANEKNKLATAEGPSVVIDEEEIRRQAIAEYLAKQQLEKEAQERAGSSNGTAVNDSKELDDKKDDAE